MGLGYSKHKKHQDNESFWTSYSDLFLGLSSIFLMLYVVASLRTGTDGLKNSLENKKLKTEIMDLRNQISTYEAIKEDYMKNQASQSEMSEYNELMDKLTLLQDEAKTEKEKLLQASKENEQKEKALNKYQQMVRNVMNASKFAKVKVTNRNAVIADRESTIDTQEHEIKNKNQKISQLSQDISAMENQISLKENQIAQAQQQLTAKMNELKTAFKKQKLTQKAYQEKLKKLKQNSDMEITALSQQKSETERNLSSVQMQLAGAQQDLQMTQNQLSQTQGELDKKGAEVGQLNQKLGQIGAENAQKIAALKGAFERERAADRAAFEGELNKQKNLSAGQIAAKEAQFKNAMAAKERKLAGEISQLAGELKDTQGKLAQANAELEARKTIAREIKNGFAKAGIRADIDMESGDVLLDFGQNYFDSDSANLKPTMKSILQKAMPAYTQALFGNQKVANQITAVEVVGFASPTYKGKFIDPKSTSKQDIEALAYNMDLSYKRAKSIFNYILDESEMSFVHRQQMVSNLKVSGRSFLELMKNDRSVASAEDYCSKHDCKKAQRVVIKFSLNKK